ncbi:MAG TPA: hypothetical protein VK900_07125 [Anaerolineales bacterium]|nr:hypothetical protein [Anaerolineales bacterium]
MTLGHPVGRMAGDELVNLERRAIVELSLLFVIILISLSSVIFPARNPASDGSEAVGLKKLSQTQGGYHVQ